MNNSSRATPGHILLTSPEHVTLELKQKMNSPDQDWSQTLGNQDSMDPGRPHTLRCQLPLTIHIYQAQIRGLELNLAFNKERNFKKIL